MTFTPSDSDQSRVDVISGVVEAAELPNITKALLLDIRTQNWGSDTFDAVICCNLLSEVRPRIPTIGESLILGVSRVLKEDGIFLLFDKIEKWDYGQIAATSGLEVLFQKDYEIKGYGVILFGKKLTKDTTLKLLAVQN